MNKSRFNVGDKVTFDYLGHKNGVVKRVIETLLEDEHYWYDVAVDNNNILVLREEYLN